MRSRPGPFDLAVDGLAAWRLTRLAIDDSITERARQAIIDKAGEDSPITTLITCPYCFSVWVAAGIVAARAAAPRAWRVAGYGLAVAAIGALLAQADAAVGNTIDFGYGDTDEHEEGGR